jgi:hypothetical protein
MQSAEVVTLKSGATEPLLRLLDGERTAIAFVWLPFPKAYELLPWYRRERNLEHWKQLWLHAYFQLFHLRRHLIYDQIVRQMSRDGEASWCEDFLSGFGVLPIFYADSLRRFGVPGEGYDRACEAKACAVEAAIQIAEIPGGGAKKPGAVEPRSATVHMMDAIACHPRTTVRWSTIIVIVSAIGRPLPHIPQHIEQAPGVGSEGTSRGGVKISIRTCPVDIGLLRKSLAVGLFGAIRKGTL